MESKYYFYEKKECFLYFAMNEEEKFICLSHPLETSMSTMIDDDHADTVHHTLIQSHNSKTKQYEVVLQS